MGSVQIMWLGMSLQQIRSFSMQKPDVGSNCWQKTRQDVWAAACHCCSAAEHIAVEYGGSLGDLWEIGKGMVLY